MQSNGFESYHFDYLKFNFRLSRLHPRVGMSSLGNSRIPYRVYR